MRNWKWAHWKIHWFHKCLTTSRAGCTLAGKIPPTQTVNSNAALGAVSCHVLHGKRHIEALSQSKSNAGRQLTGRELAFLTQFSWEYSLIRVYLRIECQCIEGLWIKEVYLIKIFSFTFTFWGSLGVSNFLLNLLRSIMQEIMQEVSIDQPS